MSADLFRTYIFLFKKKNPFGEKGIITKRDLEKGARKDLHKKSFLSRELFLIKYKEFESESLSAPERIYNALRFEVFFIQPA